MPWIRNKPSDTAERIAIVALIFGFVLYTAFATALLFVSVQNKTGLLDPSASSLPSPAVQ